MAEKQRLKKEQAKREAAAKAKAAAEKAKREAAERARQEAERARAAAEFRRQQVLAKLAKEERLRKGSYNLLPQAHAAHTTQSTMMGSGGTRLDLVMVTILKRFLGESPNTALPRLNLDARTMPHTTSTLWATTQCHGSYCTGMVDTRTLEVFLRISTTSSTAAERICRGLPQLPWDPKTPGSSGGKMGRRSGTCQPRSLTFATACAVTGAMSPAYRSGVETTTTSSTCQHSCAKRLR